MVEAVKQFVGKMSPKMEDRYATVRHALLAPWWVGQNSPSAVAGVARETVKAWEQGKDVTIAEIGIGYIPPDLGWLLVKEKPIIKR